MSKVSILGSTGVIGCNSLDVVRRLSPAWQVVALSAGKNMRLLKQQIDEFAPQYVSVQDEHSRQELIQLFHGRLPCDVGVGQAGLEEAASVPAHLVISAVLGAAGIAPTWRAISQGAVVGLANKETLVAAGDLIMEHVSVNGSSLVPVDSEHSAIFQALLAGKRQEVESFYITASGGPFRTYSVQQLKSVTLEQALQHPTWKMGAKITVDSSTLMNKGLEVIEAHHLFSAPYDKIKVLVHPQSIIHSMVEYVDGSIVAQLGNHDMRLPIQYAFTYPARVKLDLERIDFVKLRQLTFEEPDLERFPALRLAYEAGRAGGAMPCVLNAANEVAVQAFLEQRIGYLHIAEIVERLLQSSDYAVPRSISDALHIDEDVRRRAWLLIQKEELGQDV
ncbi:1-deoxy-D-xylulose-5-phosphate reductoisomerase [Alicyclobacillus tolerans]|uniref:1-deoxy-D-xylulose-5-phosphate reductoisomerase n=1 Tax=Alicyclobacillus tolerans TaxID=90970 RepID=UPI000932EAC0|nr:1-deoxy-D-xylulose-5-phosphate reductoisomerase [Alicyclobacillus montanus]